MLSYCFVCISCLWKKYIHGVGCSYACTYLLGAGYLFVLSAHTGNTDFNINTLQIDTSCICFIYSNSEKIRLNHGILTIFSDTSKEKNVGHM